MRRFMSSCLIAVALLGGSLSLSGCIVAPARVYGPRVWVRGYWGPDRVWVAPHWRYR